MEVVKIKKRRKRRKTYNWEYEIAIGNIDKFYKSTDWDIARERTLVRDKYTCQFYLGKYTEGDHKPNSIKVVTANTVHHKIPIKERPDLALEIDNLVSLSFEAHEIIEERHRWTWRKRKKILTEERW